MGNFWANKIAELTGEQPAQINPPVNPIPDSSGAWWRPQGVAQAPQSTPLMQVPNAAPTTDTVEQALALVVDPRLTKAQSARHTDTCPECGSGNYRGGLGSNEMSRCFDCGHNARFQQQAAGISGDPATSSTPSRQIKTGGFNPKTIIGRIG